MKKIKPVKKIRAKKEQVTRPIENKPKKVKREQGFNKDIQMIALWGTPGSGKTTLSVRLAKQLADEKKNVLLIHDDVFCPVLPITFPALPKGDGEKSLGKVLSSPAIDQTLILKNIINLKYSDYIGVLGHQKGENPLTYPEYTKETAVDFILLSKHLVDVVIVDCTSMTTESILTITALEMADKVIRLTTADFKGLSYLKSMLPLLADPKFNIESHLRIVSLVKSFQDKEAVNDIIRGSSIFMPWFDDLLKQELSGRMFETTDKKDYNAIIRQIMKEVFYGE